MKNVKYTPKPWSYEMRHDTNYAIITCDIKGGDNLRGYCGEANARLIVAAPELLEALEEIVSAADGNGWSQLDANLRKARTAIAKALGEKLP